MATVNVNGSLTRELSVLLHAQKLREYGVSVTEVVNALRAQNATAPVGKVRGALEDQSIRLVGRFESPAEFNQMLIKRSGDNLIRLGQVATVQDGFAEMAGYSERNGHPNVGISVTRTRDAQHGDASPRKCATWSTTINKEQAGKVQARDHAGRRRGRAEQPATTWSHSLFFGAGLTILVVYVFLNSWRSTLITGLSLPTSVITAFIAVWLCGFTLNFMSLLGLSLAIGVLIDDAIVVRENIVRHMQRGEDRRTAALNGTAEIGMAVASTTFSIVAVFAPVAFIPGITGEWFRPFGADRGRLGDREPVHLVHARPDAVGLLGRPGGPARRAAQGHRPRCSSASTTGSTTRPTATAASSSGRCTTAGTWAGRAFLSFVLRIALQARVRRLRLPAQVRQRHAGRRHPHAAQRQPRLRAHEGGGGRGAGAHAARDGGHQRLRQRRATGRIYVDIGKSTQAQAQRHRDRQRAARARWRAWSAPSTWCSTT